jgi:NAD(P)-dependent dehydrogenase (short-subunit alcohol dehydrogenase family)
VDNRDVAGLVAQEALARTLAREKRAHGMRVNIVAPGLADTESGVCPVPLYPKSGTCVSPIIGDEVGVAVTVVGSLVRVIRSLLRPAGR